MEFRDLAIQILSATTLEDKLFSPDLLTDFSPGPALCWDIPTRPVTMQFKTRSRKDKLPPLHEHQSAEKRAICLHRFAGHELLAVEIMAFALLRFPEAPANFRKGLLNTLLEEQEHVRLYIKRLNELGMQFGDLELYKHFWTHTPHIQTPLQYVSLMSLTFEMANLDFAPLYGKSFEKNGDTASADLMAKILFDEISHVRFGMCWLKKFKDTHLDDFQAWKLALPPNVDINRAKGFVFLEEPRKKAGVSQEWIDALK
ncbi:MAG: DUF455 family protein [Chlamydiales bacterium]|nr:DUF455 family protein [Chlamydiales bacterium]